MVRSCERLRHEHDLIGRVLTGVEGLVDRVRGGADVPAPPVSGAVEFFATFIERWHEAKEELALFPALAARGVPQARLIDTLQSEHEEGRALLRALRPLCRVRCIDGGAPALLATYVGLQRRHMAFENASLYPHADDVMTMHEDRQVCDAFDRIEAEVVGPAGGRIFLVLADALTEACGALPVAARPRSAGELIRARGSTVGPDDSLSHAAGLMESLGVRELPVVERDVLVGIVSRGDMEAHRGHFEWTAVRAAMTPDPVTVTPDAAVNAVARLLRERGFNAVPVGIAGKLVGMIRRSDLLGLLDEKT